MFILGILKPDEVVASHIDKLSALELPTQSSRSR
jgi:hypothetical protein